jgi:hypothetical protein
LKIHDALPDRSPPRRWAVDGTIEYQSCGCVDCRAR